MAVENQRKDAELRRIVDGAVGRAQRRAFIGYLVVLIVAVFGLWRYEDQADQKLQMAAYRLCLRGDVDRAFAHSATQDPTLRDKLPILDCTPNLYGGPARPFTDRQQIEYVRRFERGELTPTESGVCRNGLDDVPPPC